MADDTDHNDPLFSSSVKKSLSIFVFIYILMNSVYIVSRSACHKQITMIFSSFQTVVVGNGIFYYRPMNKCVLNLGIVGVSPEVLHRFFFCLYTEDWLVIIRDLEMSGTHQFDISFKTFL